MDHRRICGPSLTQTSLCGAYLYMNLFNKTELDLIFFSPDTMSAYLIVSFNNIICNPTIQTTDKNQPSKASQHHIVDSLIQAKPDMCLRALLNTAP